VLVSTAYKKLFLRCVKIDAAQRGKSIADVLTEYAIAQVKQTKYGITLVSSNTNGQLTNLLPHAGEGLTPVGYAEMISDLLDRYDEGKQALIDGGTASPTEQQIYDQVMAFLVPITEVRTDFSFINYGSANRL
jgi:hypothetical protein